MGLKKMIMQGLCFLIIFAVILPGADVFAFEENNEFRPNAFPYRVSARIFSIPLDPDKVFVVIPASLKSKSDRLKARLREKCGRDIPFRTADDLTAEDLRGRHLIILGNMSNNRWALELYKRRHAFADAYFPGRGGVIIHPTTSLWASDCNVLVIGVSSDDDLVRGFETWVGLLKKNAQAIGTLHHLETSLEFPKPPDSVATTLDDIRTKHETFPAYRDIAFWGLSYYLTGDTQWAKYYCDGCYALYERARTSGQWVPEPWTSLYFDHWRLVHTWSLLDEDPFFSVKDRAIIEELLWAYTLFLDGDDNFPHFREDIFILDDIRQNHTTFVALDLFYSHRYFKEKYGVTELDGLMEKYRPAFESQAKSYRSNDDAGFGYWGKLVFGYMYLAQNHTLLYHSLRGDDSYVEGGKLKTFADLLVTVTDNRRDGGSFGDVSGYSPNAPGTSRGMTEKYLGLMAWHLQDGQYQWLNNWIGKGAAFSLNNMYYGEYAVDIPTETPTRFLGIHPVFLDDAALMWISHRSEKYSFLPHKNRRYVDKLSFRPSFAPDDEYLLLDGTSAFAHGHQDGNTVSRLTWKDRIWLFDLDYILHTPKYHNGIIVTKDGIQEEPPPVTVLEFSADFPTVGFTRTTNEDFNGADWERNIIWLKGKYFLFLDRICSRRQGNYRFECRWRTRGDVALRGNELSVRQGDKSFYIKSADDAARRIITEPEDYWNQWEYPYGNAELQVLYARKDMALPAGSDWVYANLMYAVDGVSDIPCELRAVCRGTYLVTNRSSSELLGFDPSSLNSAGISTDCGLFLLDSTQVWLANTSRVSFGDMFLESSRKVHLTINYYTETGHLIVPEGGETAVRLYNITIKGMKAIRKGKYNLVNLKPGVYTFTYPRFELKSPNPVAIFSPAARTVLPQPEPKALKNFGLSIIREDKIAHPITAISPIGKGLLCADSHGRVTLCNNERCSEIFQIPSAQPITTLSTADLDNSGQPEIILGDEDENLYLYSSSGKHLWTYKMQKFYGPSANAVDIAVGDPVGRGKARIFVATKGFKLYGFDAGGQMMWETLIRYHLLTRVKFLQNSNKKYVATGTVYSTPLNVVSPEDGKVLWYIWEQVGDEANSVTDYCGIHLTDLVFIDTDRDGEKEIVFGTKYNRIYALNAADGATKWEANVGDEVTVMKTFISPRSGEERLLVGTDAGDLFLYNHAGVRLQSLFLGGSIAGIDIISHSEHKRVDIVTATRHGRVTICDDAFLIRASHTFEKTALQGIVVGEKSGPEHCIFAVSDRSIHLMKYRPYFLRKSRFY